MLTEMSRKYFEIFSAKDLDGLAEMFADDVVLRDWEISALGKEDVLAANQKIFESVTNISVKPLKSCEQGNTVMTEIEIDVNADESKLLVVDVIDFDGQGKIKSVRAYKG